MARNIEHYVASDNLGADIASMYRGWHELATTAEIKPYDVIDCDVAPPCGKLSFPNEGSVSNAIDSMLEGLRETPHSPILGAKLVASLAFLGAMKQEVDYLPYIEATMGMQPVMVPDDVLEARAAELAARLREDGIGWNVAARLEYEKQRRITVQSEIAELAKNTREFAEHGAVEYFGVRAEGVQMQVEPHEKEWQASTYTTDSGEIIVEVNSSAKVPWTDVEITETVSHEIIHAAQLRTWGRAILDATSPMGPAEGITTMHTPELVHMELLALLGSNIFLTDTGDPRNTLQAMYSIYHTQVKSNIQYMINTGHSEADCLKYAQEHLPLEDLEGFKESLPFRRDNPAYRAYIAAYGIALDIGLGMLDMPKDTQRKVLRDLFMSPPMTASQIVSKLDHAQHSIAHAT